MVAAQIHLVRHGEVHNPDKVLYGRIPGFRLSDLGARMARAAAEDLIGRERPITRLYASPLQRAQESAAPIAELTGLDIVTEPRIIEPTNRFEGMSDAARNRALRNPAHWHWVANPFRPSWGEAYRSISARMAAAMRDAYESAESGDVVLVSHQLPIWTTHLTFAGKPLYHDPRKRRCNLSSITSFEWRDGTFVEVGYSDPARALMSDATDVGAV